MTNLKFSAVKYLPVLALGVVAWTGCSEPRLSSGASDTAGMRSAFETASADFHQGLRANDTTLFVHVADDVVLMAPGEPVVRGKAAMREWYRGFLSQFHTASLTFADREVFVSDELAMDLGTYEWTLTPAAGGASVVDRGNYMQLWKKQLDGQWRFAREIWNSSAPPAPPAN